MVTDREDGGLVVEGIHLLWEEPANGAEQQAADTEGVLPLAPLHDSGDLPRLVPLHEDSPKYGKATQLRVIRVGAGSGVGGQAGRGERGGAG